jgi:TonB family protein
MSARRRTFAALVVLLHAGLILAILVQHAAPIAASLSPAMVGLDVRASVREIQVPALPVELQPELRPLLRLPSPRYPADEPIPSAPVSTVTAPAGGAQGIFVQDVDYLRPLEIVYPRAARRRRAQGLVLVYVLVGSDGTPWEVRLFQSSGEAELDEAAVSAVRKALFKPRQVNGEAQPVKVLVPVNFHLDVEPAAARIR